MSVLSILGARVSLSSGETFRFFLKNIQPRIVLDVGSRDGADALRLKRILPGSDVIAFEANPELGARMQADRTLADAGIRVLQAAVSDRRGEATFSVHDAARGTGSLLEPTGRDVVSSDVVQTIRLDDLPELQHSQTVAMWIDVEGFAYEVLCGAEGFMDSVAAVHVEVETSVLWKSQRLFEAVETLLTSQGFVQVGTMGDSDQHNVCFVHPRSVSASTLARLALLATYRGVGNTCRNHALHERFPGAFRVARRIGRRFVSSTK